jgi:hypothetical protein
MSGKQTKSPTEREREIGSTSDFQSGENLKRTYRHTLLVFPVRKIDHQLESRFRSEEVIALLSEK